MIFVGVALLVAVGLALIISTDAGQLIGLDQPDTAQLIALVAILILVAGGAFGRRYPLSQILANIVIWIGIFAVFAIGYTYRAEFNAIANRVMGEFAPGEPVVSDGGETVSIRRGLGGSFRLKAQINGVEVAMVFDTGASAVVLSHHDAERAGIDMDALRFNVPVQTANGTGRAARTRIDEIAVGGIVRRNVIAFIAADDALETSLLGMSFLETLESYSVSRDTLELRN